MITFKITKEGLEVTRFLPFIISGNGEGGLNSSSDSPSPLITKLEENTNGKNR